MTYKANTEPLSGQYKFITLGSTVIVSVPASDMLRCDQNYISNDQ